MDLVDAHRVALLGDEQALALGVVGQPLETLVAVEADTQRKLLGIGSVDEARIVLQAHLDQALLALVGDHVDTAADVLDGLGVAEAGQRDGPQYLALQGQLDDLRRLVGHGEQGAPVGIEGQRGNVVVQPLDRLRLDPHTVVRQPYRALFPGIGVTPLLDGEPGPVEDAEALAEKDQRGQRDQQDGQQQTARRESSGHGKRLGSLGVDSHSIEPVRCMETGCARPFLRKLRLQAEAKLKVSQPPGRLGQVRVSCPKETTREHPQSSSSATRLACSIPYWPHLSFCARGAPVIIEPQQVKRAPETAKPQQ